MKEGSALPKNETYYHSVRLDVEKCKGCTICLKHCPTEAIRIRNNRATILSERCIDCGECIKVCKHHAKVAVTDPLDIIHKKRYAIALPAPTLYAQFPGEHKATAIIAALFRLGFDDVFEVARGAEVVSYAIGKTLISQDRTLPVISSACPAIVRMIQINFPSLIENIIDIVSPMEAAARIAKEEFARKHGVPAQEIGAYFITPCAAKVTAVRAPIGQEESCVDGVISILDVYTAMNAFIKEGVEPFEIDRASAVGIRWAAPGGEATAVGSRNALCVDGIENVMRVLEQIENNRFDRLDYFEGLACVNGCLGGPLTVENAYVAKNRLNRIIKHAEQKKVNRTAIFEHAQDTLRMTKPIEPNNVLQLEGTIFERLEKAQRIEQILASLPGLDCGSCGSPTCRALAWDIVHGHASEMNCIHKLNERISALASQMIELERSTRFSSPQEGEKNATAGQGGIKS